MQTQSPHLQLLKVTNVSFQILKCYEAKFQHERLIAYHREESKGLAIKEFKAHCKWRLSLALETASMGDL